MADVRINPGGCSKQRRQLRRSLERHLGSDITKEILSSRIQDMPNRPATDKTIMYLRGFGAIGFLVGLAGMIFTSFFWPAIGLLAVAFLAGIVDVWRERDLPMPAKIAISAAICGIGIWIAKVVVFYPAPIETSSSWFKADYPDGTNVSGINWKSGYSELRVSFHNQSERDYDDAEFLLSIPQAFDEVAQVTSLPCFRVQSNIISAHDSQSDVFQPLGENAIIHFSCPKLPKDSTVQFLIAVVNMDAFMRSAENGKQLDLPFGLYGPKIKPQWLKIKAEYKATFRPHVIERKVGITG